MSKQASGTDGATDLSGPWQYEKPEDALPYYVYSGNDRHGGNEIAVLYGKHREPHARLMAAAPELLDALELARSWVALRLGDTHEDLMKIDAAIRKAKGL
jgi:hypothetical protein